MKKTFSLAYSPCPNDTFIFHAMTHGLVDTCGLSFKPFLDDVETLNSMALKGTPDITKLSTAAFAHLMDRYAMLYSGSALGRGCGPLIVKRTGVSSGLLPESRIAVPGVMTTAFSLLSFYLGKRPDSIPMSFERIMPAVANGDFDFGVIIHEGRFTYSRYGLEIVEDLGQWWESFTGLPIPLGCIAVKRELADEYAAQIDGIIEKSILYAYDNPDASVNYIKQHAQELDDPVIRQHINLYVNDFSVKLGQDGLKAVEVFIGMGEERGFWESGKEIFYRDERMRD